MQHVDLPFELETWWVFCFALLGRLRIYAFYLATNRDAKKKSRKIHQEKKDRLCKMTESQEQLIEKSAVNNQAFGADQENS